MTLKAVQPIKVEWTVQMPSGKKLTLYSKEDADDFNAMLEAVRRDALESAAKVCDKEGEQWADHTSKLVGFHCAAAIRALKDA